jgi:hypothetical protein
MSTITAVESTVKTVFGLVWLDVESMQLTRSQTTTGEVGVYALLNGVVIGTIALEDDVRKRWLVHIRPGSHVRS